MSESLPNKPDHKLVFEFFKHLTTLCTGSILVIVALVEKFLPHPIAPDHLLSVRNIIIGFTGSLLSSLLMMLYLAIGIEGKTDRIVFFFAFMFSGCGFLAGMILLLRFIARLNGLWFP